MRSKRSRCTTLEVDPSFLCRGEEIFEYGIGRYDPLLFFVSESTQPPFRFPVASLGSCSSRSYGGFPRQTNTRTLQLHACARFRSSVSCACSRLAVNCGGLLGDPECRSGKPWESCRSRRRSSNSRIGAGALPNRDQPAPRRPKGARPGLSASLRLLPGQTAVAQPSVVQHG